MRRQLIQCKIGFHFANKEILLGRKKLWFFSSVIVTRVCPTTCFISNTCIRGVFMRHPTQYCHRNQTLLTPSVAQWLSGWKQPHNLCHEPWGVEGKRPPPEWTITGSKTHLSLTLNMAQHAPASLRRTGEKEGKPFKRHNTSILKLWTPAPDTEDKTKQ